MSKGELAILGIGFGGQALFSMRFLVQWISSERERRSVVPLSFWFYSLGGSLLLLIYALVRRDLVFILGQSTGFLIYSRNIYLILRERRQRPADSNPAA